jgi:hypothetical protein
MHVLAVEACYATAAGGPSGNGQEKDANGARTILAPETTFEAVRERDSAAGFSALLPAPCQ